MDYAIMIRSLKKNLPVVISCVLIIGLLLIGIYYLNPLHESQVTIENALYRTYASFSAIVLIMITLPKHLRFAFSFLLVALILNTLALVVNDGYMPVASLSFIYVEGYHSPFYETARLPLLCDWVFGVASVGDIISWLFFPAWVFSMLFLRGKQEV